MLKWICRIILMTANAEAFMSCSIHKWGEEEMPESLRIINKY